MRSAYSHRLTTLPDLSSQPQTIEEILSLSIASCTQQEALLQQITYLQILKSANKHLDSSNSTSGRSPGSDAHAQHPQTVPNQPNPKNVVAAIARSHGSYLSFRLELRLMQSCMDRHQEEFYDKFPLLQALSEWMDFGKTLSKQLKVKDARLTPLFLNEFLILRTQLSRYEELPVLLNFIGKELLEVISEPRSKLEGTSVYLLQPEDMVDFLNLILPRCLYNIVLPRTFGQVVAPAQANMNPGMMDCLFICRKQQALSKSKPHYQNLVKTIFQILNTVQLEPQKSKQLVELSFRYFYLFHHQIKFGADKIVLNTLSRLQPAVRYAVSDELMLFLKVLIKLDCRPFIQELEDQFEETDWINPLLDVVLKGAIIGTSYDAVEPPNTIFTADFQVERGSKRFIHFQIYDAFSIAYCMLNCLYDDINVQLVYLGEFDSKVEKNRLIFRRQRLSGILKQYLPDLPQGLYRLELDNSYSWVKGKTLRYQLFQLSPVQKWYSEHPSWIKLIFDTPHSIVSKYQTPTAKEGRIYLSESEGIFSLRLVRANGSIYEYETADSNLFVKKVTSLKGNFSWSTAQEPHKIFDLFNSPLDIITKRQMDEDESESSTSLNHEVEFEELPTQPPKQKSSLPKSSEEIKSSKAQNSTESLKGQIDTNKGEKKLQSNSIDSKQSQKKIKTEKIDDTEPSEPVNSHEELREIVHEDQAQVQKPADMQVPSDNQTSELTGEKTQIEVSERESTEQAN